MSRGRLKALALILVAATGVLVLLAWSQTWFEVDLPNQTITVGGDVAGAALAPLAGVSLVLALALTFAGRVFRIILGVLEALLGLVVALVTGIALGDPVTASSPSITEATGVSGSGSVADVVGDVDITAWPIVALVAGILMSLVGIGIALTGHRWPETGRKYSRSRLESADAASPVDEWDALSEGDDPTGSDPNGPGGPPR